MKKAAYGSGIVAKENKKKRTVLDQHVLMKCCALAKHESGVFVGERERPRCLARRVR